VDRGQNLRQNIAGQRTLLEDLGLAAGAVGILGEIGAGLLYLFVEPLQTWAIRLSLVAMLLIAISIGLSWRALLSFLRARQGRYGLNTAVMISALLAIIIVVNVIGVNNPIRSDLTATRQFTLAPQTEAVLNQLEKPVEAFAFFTPRMPQLAQSQQEAVNLLREYSVTNRNFSYELVDIDQRPSIAIQYGVTEPGTVAFATEDRTQLTSEVSERSFTTALLQVSGQGLKTVCFLEGHGERTIYDPSGTGFSEASLGLERDNYLVRHFNSVTDAPEDLLQRCTVLVIAGPQQDLTEDELGLLNEYLVQSGKAFFLLDPGAPPTFKYLLLQWGVGVLPGFIVDPDNRSDPLTPIVSQDLMAPSPITDVLDTAFFPEAVSLRSMVNPDNPGLIESVFPIVASGARSWLETSEEGDITFDESQDLPGPVPMGMMVESIVDPESGTVTRVVAIGDSDFARNDFFLGRSNADLFLNSVNWLSDQEFLISVRPKASNFRILLLSDLQWRFILISSVGLLPILIISLGGITWWLRR